MQFAWVLSGKGEEEWKTMEAPIIGVKSKKCGRDRGGR